MREAFYFCPPPQFPCFYFSKMLGYRGLLVTL